MAGFANLSRRVRSAEVMDQPDLDAERHVAALRGLSRINWISGSAGIVWPAIAALARADAPRPIRVLDVACGGGDIVCRLATRAARQGLKIEWSACDISPRALDVAVSGARAAGVHAHFFVHDALSGRLPDGYDVLISSLFLHHLAEEDAESLLRRMAEAARDAILVNDLRRCRAGLGLAHLAGRALTRSDVVRTDAVLSVKAAFTVGEAARLAGRAGLTGATIRRRWPCRWLLTWLRNDRTNGSDVPT